MGRIVLNVQSPRGNIGPPPYESKTVGTYARNLMISIALLFFSYLVSCFSGAPLFFSLFPFPFGCDPRYAAPRHMGRTEGSYTLVTVCRCRSIFGRNEQEGNKVGEGRVSRNFVLLGSSFAYNSPCFLDFSSAFLSFHFWFLIHLLNYGYYLLYDID